MTTVAAPGDHLAPLTTHHPGTGTYTYESTIRASLAGTITTAPAPSKSGKPTISVTPNPLTPNPELPKVGSSVLARVLRVEQRQLRAAILLVDPTPATVTPYPAHMSDELQFQAILRREDVRSYEKDKIVMKDSFRVGDVIKASVISLGDERSYYVSTAGNEFGVVVARSEGGGVLVPVSWKEMRDVHSGVGETRKVAKPT